MALTILKNGKIVNRGNISEGDLLIKDDRIEQVGGVIIREGANEIDCSGCYIIPGIIDDQVHFREPGLTYKADIASESRAAIAGGVTSFMEMPNTKPNALTQELLQDKYDIGHQTAYSNYSFFMGAGNENLEEVLKTNPKDVCGVKVFMGSSTGNMLVDNEKTLEGIFSRVDMLIATHCEDEATIRRNIEIFKDRYGNKLRAVHHPQIRNTEGCLISSSLAASLAKKHGARLHILHISTADELDLFRNDIPLKEKKLTSELCVHHAYFSAEDYPKLGNRIKCNPAIKGIEHQSELLPALLDNRLDIIATDHAPHTLEEKERNYSNAPSGLPLVQHSLNIMLEFCQQGKISLERIVEKMCHAPAECFLIEGRGFLDEGFKADIAIVDPDMMWTVAKDNILYKCQWSPLEGKTFKGRVVRTYVNGVEVYNLEDQKYVQAQGQRLTFDR